MSDSTQRFRASASTAFRMTALGSDVQFPQASGAVIGAAECFAAARQLNTGRSDNSGQYILTFQAIELGLKAFLMKRGMKEKVLRSRPYGHDLLKLYDAAVQRGLSLEQEHVVEYLSWINEWHGTTMIRYEFLSSRSLPICETLFPLIELDH